MNNFVTSLTDMRRSIFFILFIISSNLFSQKNSDVELANEYYSQGDYDKAMVLFDNLAKDFSNIPLIHNNYFFLLLEQGDFKKSEKYIKRLMKRFPSKEPKRNSVMLWLRSPLLVYITCHAFPNLSHCYPLFWPQEFEHKQRLPTQANSGNLFHDLTFLRR